MKTLNHRFIFSNTSKSHSNRYRLTLFCLWLLGVSFLISVHVVWRDEVRALSYALQGNNEVAMVAALHGEGHPALWYVLLREAHILFPVPQVLPALALSIAVTAVWMLVFHSPFSLSVITIILASRFVFYEYSVMARNYGISMLLMFLFAYLYQNERKRSWVLGSILFLLANTNTYSVLLVAALLMFWLLDIIDATGFRWSPELKHFLPNALFACLGILVCALTVHPLINDAAIYDHSQGISAIQIADQILDPASAFDSLLGHPFNYLQEAQIGKVASRALSSSLSMGLFIATLGLLSCPPAFIAAIASLVVFTLFFGNVAPGFYRHEALWLVFLVTLYWIKGKRDMSVHSTPSKLGAYGQSAETLGSIAFLILLLMQIPGTLVRVAHPGHESRSLDLAELIKRSPRLHNAVIVADPDYLVEALPYFISNPTYLLREKRFGHIPIYRKSAQLDLSLEEILATARWLRSSCKQPVIILLQQRLKLAQPDSIYREGYDWQLIATKAMTRDFLESVIRIESFPNAPLNADESFDVYELP